MVYFSTYTNPLYFTSDLRQIRYSTHPTYYKHVVLQLPNGLVAAAPGPLACPAAALGPYPVLTAALGSEIVLP